MKPITTFDEIPARLADGDCVVLDGKDFYVRSAYGNWYLRAAKDGVVGYEVVKRILGKSGYRNLMKSRRPYAGWPACRSATQLRKDVSRLLRTVWIAGERFHNHGTDCVAISVPHTPESMKKLFGSDLDGGGFITWPVQTTKDTQALIRSLQRKYGTDTRIAEPEPEPVVVYLVSAKNGEFVGFTDRRDAYYAANGQAMACTPTIGEHFRDCYEGTHPIIEITLSAAQAKEAGL